MAKARKPKAAHGTGVCAFAYELIRKGKDNAAVLTAVQKKFPTSQFTIGSVAWCRNKLRKDGEKVKMNKELKKAA